MKQTLSVYEAASQLHDDRDGGWSWDGALALATYLEELEEDMGEEIEFDRVAIRCDFSEYRNLVGWAKEYFGQDKEYFGQDKWKEEIGVEENTLDEERDERIREYIHENGTLIEFDTGIIVSSF
jgi:hypothetical protein